MAESEFPDGEANGNLHQQPPAELVEDHHDPLLQTEPMLQQLNMDDADDNTDIVQEVAESSAASNHGVQEDHVDNIPGHLHEVEPPPAAAAEAEAAEVIEIAPHIYLPLLSREDDEFTMSLPRIELSEFHPHPPDL